MSHVRVGGTWRELMAGTAVRVGGTWRDVAEIHVRVSGVWRLAWQALSVVFATITLPNTRPGGSGTCVSNVRLDNDGDVYYSDFGGSFSSQGAWLQAGDVADVWCERTAVSGGSLDVDPWGSTGTRRQMSSDRTFGISQTGLGTKGPVTFTINWYDAASGGNLLESTSVSLSASVEA